MAIRSLVRCNGSAVLRFAPLVLLFGLLGASVQPARAALDYCSTDPVFVFQRKGSSATAELDVQVMVPISELPLRSAANLDVVTPTSVRTDVVNPPNPAFPLSVNVSAKGAKAKTDRYQVKFVLTVPRSNTAFPVRLVVTDPSSASVQTVDGVAGQPLAVYVDVGR